MPSARPFEGVDSGTLFSFRLGRVPTCCFSPRIQQTETDRTFSFLIHSNFRGAIGLLFTRPSHSRSRILGTATTAGRYPCIPERFSIRR